MPSVDIAMVRSLRPPVWNLVRDALIRGVAKDLSPRSIVDDTQTKITNVKTAFSSWDNCMKATFCKWPVIAIIIIGSLIIFSVCCGDCCGCCDPPGGRKTKSIDEPFIPSNNHGQGYHTQTPMQTHPPPEPAKSQPQAQAPTQTHYPPIPAKFQPPTQTPTQTHYPPPLPAEYQRPTQAPMPTHRVSPEPAKLSPQYAVFDVSKKVSDDALPPMSTWEQAPTHKVLVKEEVEMSNLKRPPQNQAWQRSNAPSPGPVSPISTMSMNFQPHGDHHGGSNGPMSSHGPQGSAQNQQAMTGYGRVEPTSGLASGSTPRSGPFGARDAEHHQNYKMNRHSDGFGLDEPYIEPSPLPSTIIYGSPSEQTSLHDTTAQQPYDNLANQPFGAVAGAGAAGAGAGSYMGRQNQTSTSPRSQPYDAPPMGSRDHYTNSNNHQPQYGAPPNMGVAMASSGRQSPAPAQAQALAYRHNPYGQEQIEKVAEMPANPLDHGSIRSPTHLQQSQTSPTGMPLRMELPGSVPPEAHEAKVHSAVHQEARRATTKAPADHRLTHREMVQTGATRLYLYKAQSHVSLQDQSGKTRLLLLDSSHKAQSHVSLQDQSGKTRLLLLDSSHKARNHVSLPDQSGKTHLLLLDSSHKARSHVSLQDQSGKIRLLLLNSSHKARKGASLKDRIGKILLPLPDSQHKARSGGSLQVRSGTIRLRRTASVNQLLILFPGLGRHQQTVQLACHPLLNPLSLIMLALTSHRAIRDPRATDLQVNHPQLQHTLVKGRTNLADNFLKNHRSSIIPLQDVR
ncbi:hypothetical protein E4U21_004647 [Claviceps maximensis]|nr:hypothetical protein E4U21_004647 [Claviceps maximensis]